MFTWSYLDRAGQVTGSSHPFPDRDEAEEWLGSSWEALLRLGVTEVALIDESAPGRPAVYTMSLAEA